MAASGFGWRDFGGRRVALFLASYLAGVLLVGAAAFAVWPFGGSGVVPWMGLVLAFLVHATLAALVVRSIFEFWFREGWGRRDWVVNVAVALGTLVLGVAVVVMGRHVSSMGLSVTSERLYFGTAVGGLLFGSVIAGAGLRSRRDPSKGGSTPGSSRREAVALWFVVGTGGLALGAFLMVVVVAGFAYRRNAQLDHFHPEIPVIAGIDGEYVILGDSYSAGEGLPPYDAWTTQVADGHGSDRCHRSSRAYSQLLRFEGPEPPQRFVACSGALIADIYRGFNQSSGALTAHVDPQADGERHPEVGLVTLTVGGNDMLFSKIVKFCVIHSGCMTDRFRPGVSDGGRHVDYPEPEALGRWIRDTIPVVGRSYERLLPRLRRDFPNARVVVLGYPYLFPGGDPGYAPNDCASVLRRVSESERAELRDRTDDFNGLLYEQAVQAHVEFVSPVAIWDGHEPCGDAGQFTNSVKPIGGEGSFHPSRSGQQALAQIVACYLNSHPEAPDAFIDGQPRALDLSGTDSPADLGLAPPPGSADDPIACQ